MSGVMDRILPMMRLLRFACCLLLLATLMPVVSGEARAQMRRENTATSSLVEVQLPPDQRRQMRQEMREHWQRMPPEQRARFREERRERLQQMPPEDRQRLREEMRGRREDFGGQGQGQRGGGNFRGGRP